MPNLMSTLISSATALSVFERALVVTENNVANASTPGYAVQRLALQAMDFEPELGLIGGVRAGDVESARDQYAELAVRRQLESLGLYDQKAASLASLESVFSIGGDTSLPGALSRLYDSFSAWSLTPNSGAARQAVLDRAQEFTESFHQAAASLASVSSDMDRQLRETADRINSLGEQLLSYNHERRRGGIDDAGLDAKIQVALEELSELVDFTAVFQADGSVTVLLGGQSPLVIGEELHPIHVSFFDPADPPPIYTGTPPSARLITDDGKDITAQIAGGRLSGILDVRNRVLPSLRGDAYQPGGLNLLAKAVADRINALLTSGNITDGPPPVAGLPLFTYDASSDAMVARSLAVNPAIAPDQLAAIDPGPPYSSNGMARKLAALANSQDEADRIDGFSFTEYYGRLAAGVGRALEDARGGRDFKTQMVAQARSLRSEISGVSLDEEAVHLIEFERAYQATARLVSVLDELTETTVNLLR